ncbi:MAG: hypothetical protein K8R85_15260 [Bacteroidetes bacterium]|nr:hypothetical protein [Bacteroidota bacterium]
MTFSVKHNLTPSSHTHLQATQTNTQPKLTNKYACPTHNDRQKSTGGNSTYPKGGVSCFADTFVQAENSVLLMKFSGKNPALRVGKTLVGI